MNHFDMVPGACRQIRKLRHKHGVTSEVFLAEWAAQSLLWRVPNTPAKFCA